MKIFYIIGYICIRFVEIVIINIGSEYNNGACHRVSSTEASSSLNFFFSEIL